MISALYVSDAIFNFFDDFFVTDSLKYFSDSAYQVIVTNNDSAHKHFR